MLTRLDNLDPLAFQSYSKTVVMITGVHIILPSSRENLFSGLPTRSDTNLAVLPQNNARGLKFRIAEVEVLYYLCRENKGAAQLHGYREADLRLWFCICKSKIFS